MNGVTSVVTHLHSRMLDFLDSGRRAGTINISPCQVFSRRHDKSASRRGFSRLKIKGDSF